MGYLGLQPEDSTELDLWPDYTSDYMSYTKFEDLDLQIDEDGTIYYSVMANNAGAPSSADVVAGTGAVVSGSTPITGLTQIQENVTGLSNGTPYDIYVVAEDSRQNLQASPTLIEVTTQLITLP